jgi:glycolate oxidase iron-sulfur subunit
VDDATRPQPPPRAARLLAEADLCVKCGLCLPCCPTYALSRDEGESPRGRIALGQGLAAGELAVTVRLAEHLDSCLACRACEAACPAGVPYGRIVDGARALLAERRPPGRLRRWLLGAAARGPVDRPLWWRLATAALRGYARGRLRTPVERLLARVAPPLARLARYVRPMPAPSAWRSYYPPVGDPRGEVALFLGCVARDVDRATLEASIRVLTRLGLGVRVPEGQGCCGAIHLHAGDEAAAAALARRNLAAFSRTAGPLVVTASGCAATLAEYHRLPGIEAEEARAAGELARRVVDVSDFVAGLEWPADVTLAPLRERVAVHEPCSLRNVLRRGEAPYRLLARIPGLVTVPLPGNDRCCGSAGTYMVTRPAVADRLRDEKLTGLARAPAVLVATANVGCALHLAAGLAGPGDIEVVHPVVILDRQLRQGAPEPVPAPPGPAGPRALAPSARGTGQRPGDEG